MVGILVHSDNHFIARGPLPDREVALALVRHWSLIQIGATYFTIEYRLSYLILVASGDTWG